MCPRPILGVFVHESIVEWSTNLNSETLEFASREGKEAACTLLMCSGKESFFERIKRYLVLISW